MHLGAALRLILERPLVALVGALSLALGLILAGVSLWLLGVAGAAEGSIEDQVVVRAHLDPTLDEGATRQTLLSIGALEGVREVAWVGPRAQRDELQGILGDELLAGLDEAVFPRGGLARVTLERGVITDRDALASLRERVAAIDRVTGIERVPFESRHLEFIFNASDVGRLVGLGLAALALIAGALAIYQHIALALLARREELVLFRAFGATERWLMGRYIALAAIIGLAAAGIGILVGVSINAPLADLASLIPGNPDATVTSPAYLVGTLGGGVGGALLAGLYAVRREQRSAR